MADDPDRPDPPTSRLPPPPRGGQPILNAPPATSILCLVLLAVFLATRFVGIGPDSPAALLAFDSARFRAQFAPGGGVDIWSCLALVGHALLHVDFGHFLVNTLMLLAFGSLVERTFGAAAFLLVFVASAVAGALAAAALVGATPVYMVGASGSVHGLGGLAAVIMRRHGDARLRRAGGVLLAFLVGINLVLAVAGGAAGLVGFYIAWQAHLGGLAAGLLLAPALFARRARRR